MKKLLSVVMGLALLIGQAAWSQGQDAGGPPASVEEMTREIWHATNEMRELLRDLAAPSLDEALLTGNTLVLTSSEERLSYVAFSAAGRHATHTPGDAGLPGWYPGNYLYDLDDVADAVTLRLTWDPANSHNEFLWIVALTFSSETEGAYTSSYLEYGKEMSTGSGTFEIVGLVETDPPPGEGEIIADTISAANDPSGEDDDEDENPKE